MNLAGIIGNTQDEIRQSLIEYFNNTDIVEIGSSGGRTVTTYRRYIMYWPITKKMKSKSKQSRYVRVVMKGEWK